MGRNIPELVFVSLVAFFVYDLSTLKMASAQVVKTSVGNVTVLLRIPVTQMIIYNQGVYFHSN